MNNHDCLLGIGEVIHNRGHVRPSGKFQFICVARVKRDAFANEGVTG